MYWLKMHTLSCIFLVGFIVMMFFTPDGIPTKSAQALAMTSLGIFGVLLFLARQP
jgi:hypothetical protein